MAAAELAMVTAAAKKPKFVVAPSTGNVRKISNKELREHSDLEVQMAKLEADIAELEVQLADPQFFVTKAAEVNDYLKKVEQKKAELDKRFTRWAELEEIKAAS